MRGRFWCKTQVWRQPNPMPYGGVTRDMPYEGFDCINNRDTVDIKCYPCHSHLIISCHETEDRLTKITIHLEHHVKHVHYVNVSMPPGALDIICENVGQLTPVAMVAKVQAAFPDITAGQIHTATGEQYWGRDNLELPSAEKLPADFGDDVDVFEY